MLIIQTQNIKVHALSSQALLATKRDSPYEFILHKAIVMYYIAGIAEDGVKRSNAIELFFMGPEACMVNAAGQQQRTAYI